jgi:hypothetical protein
LENRVYLCGRESVDNNIGIPDSLLQVGYHLERRDRSIDFKQMLCCWFVHFLPSSSPYSHLQRLDSSPSDKQFS